jgi:hypothetical protein
MNIGSSNSKSIGLWLAAAVLGTGLATMAPSATQALPLHDSGLQKLAAGQQDVQTVQYRRHWGGHHHGYRHGYRHRGWRGPGVGLGLGLATGALIGGAIASQGAYAVVPDDADGYCASRFKSYDPSSGTYLGYDGRRHPCP